MARYLYIFGYVTPEAEEFNRKHDKDDEFSQALFVEADSEALALQWGREVSEEYVKWLFKNKNVSWKKQNFAHWIEHGNKDFNEEELQKLMCVREGEYPDFPRFHSL